MQNVRSAGRRVWDYLILNLSFARQLLARARIKLVVVNGLHADNRGDAENVVRVRAARDVRGRPVEAEPNLAVGVRARNVADKLAGYVAGIKVGENQDVGMAGDPAFRQFARGNFRDQGRVHLE